VAQAFLESASPTVDLDVAPDHRPSSGGGPRRPVQRRVLVLRRRRREQDGRRRQRLLVHQAAQHPRFDFDWGETGTSDDPRLNLDDTGSGVLVENVSLNYPEHDPKCDAAPAPTR